MKIVFLACLFAMLFSCERKAGGNGSPVRVSRAEYSELIQILDFIKEGNFLLKRKGFTDEAIILASSLEGRSASEEVVLSIVRSGSITAETAEDAKKVLIEFQKVNFPGLKVRFTTLLEE